MDVIATIISYRDINCDENIIKKVFSPEDFSKIKFIWEKSSNITTMLFDGVTHHFRNGILHRSDGPAKHSDDTETWYKKGYKHRSDGPAIIKYEINTKIPKLEEWWLNGKPQRPGKEPCVIEYKNGKIITEKWMLNGQKHRSKDLPAIIKYFDSGMIRECRWYTRNDLHRKNGPAIICYHEDGSLKYECWISHGLFHRYGGPAEITYSRSGEIEGYCWVFYGVINRTDGPALFQDGSFYWYLEGQIHRFHGPAVESINLDIWYLNGKIHRDDGPAVIGKEKFKGYLAWYHNNFKHRDCEPAVIFPGNKVWYKHGILFRSGGPAIESPLMLQWSESEGSTFDTIIRDDNGKYRCYSGFADSEFYTKEELYDYFKIKVDLLENHAEYENIEAEIDREIFYFQWFCKSLHDLYD